LTGPKPLGTIALDVTKLRVPMHDGVFVDCGLFGLALRTGFPGVWIGPDAYLSGGWEAWARFCRNTENISPGERAAAWKALGAHQED
jgi:hypothetical protein